MVHQTEAACLLQTGTMYKRRIGLKGGEGGAADLVFAGFKPGAFSLYYDDAPIFHFDLDGRWQRAFIGQTHYLKGLDTGVQAIDRVRVGENLILRRRTLPYAEASDLDATIRRAAIDLAHATSTGDLKSLEPPPAANPISGDTLIDMLDRIAGWDAAAWFASRERYLDTYGPLPFLPPECQGAVTLQATLGPGDERGFGVERPKPGEDWREVRTQREFAAHVEAVSTLVGRREFQSRVLFLAGPDVLRQPIDEVAGYLETATRRFPIGTSPGDESVPGSHRFRGVHAFMDEFSRPRPDAKGFRRLQALGLRRVHLGIESGDPGLRAPFGRTWNFDDLIELVTDIKQAGLGVSIVALLGTGGDLVSGRHMGGTGMALVHASSAGLGTGDLVTLVDVADLPGGLPSGTNVTSQASVIRAGSSAKVVTYNPEKQWR